MDCCDNTFKDKEDRKGAFFTATQSICPKCRRTIQAKVIFRDGRVVLSKRCMIHGEFEALLSSDINYWVKSLSYTKPGTKPKQWSTPVEKGCPDDCGLCEDHEQHTCSPIVEISNKCDLKCPICIVWNENNYDMSLEDFKKVTDGLLEKEGSLELMLLSGGEPTLHPDFFKLAEYATSQKNIKRVLVSSHGLRIARNREFAKKFKEAGLYLSLQFDSMEDKNYHAIRGENLLELKMKCLEHCEEFDIPTILVPTIAKGYNDHEIGKIIDFALSKDFITSVTLQPAAYTGAGGTSFPSDPLQKLTQYDIHKLIGEQSTWLEKEDFLPIPCSHPSCYTASYVLKVDDKKFVPLTHFGDLAVYMDALTNRAIMDVDNKASELIQDAIYNLWSAQSVTVDSEGLLKSLKAILKEYQQAGTLEQDQLWKLSETKVKAIFIHAFMDEFDFDVARIRKCCTHYALPDGRLMPGCAYNNIHRFKDQRLKLDGVKVPERTELEP
ncbi:MAG: radical SAM protein [Bacteriovoracaceae bacterium]|jgi:7,8-dihydro-6-hydroxymethylpterin dimethyltransferase|nr:radical SAM protein [Bacteriovoracaceae bacterium]